MQFAFTGRNDKGNPQPSPLSSRAEPRDLRLHLISNEAQGLQNEFSSQPERSYLATFPTATNLDARTDVLSRPEPSLVREPALSKVERGPAVHSISNDTPGNPPLYPLSSRAKPRDLRLHLISNEAQGLQNEFSSRPERSYLATFPTATNLDAKTDVSSRPDRSGVEGPAVHSISNDTPGNPPLYPLSSRAEPRDLRLHLISNEAQGLPK